MRMLPYFPFYPGEWLRSPTTMGMSLQDQGAYLKLLCVQWEDSCVDPEDIPAILGLDDAAVTAMFGRRVWRKAFPVSDDGMRRNARLDMERETAIHKAEVASKAAHARWDKHKSDGSPVRKRRSASAELQVAIDEYNSAGETLSSDLVEAMTDYMKAGQKDGRPMWSSNKWRLNFPDALSSKFTDAQWVEAYLQGARNGWKSVYPKESDGRGPGAKPTNRALNNLARWENDGAY